MKSNVSPGINHSAHSHLSYFTPEEQKIVKTISKEWYVTSAGNLDIANSKYRYILIKPTPSYQEMFNLEREIVVLFSGYPAFEPRVFDAIDQIIKKYQALRIERICSVLCSQDGGVERKVSDLLKNDQELQVVIPFTYNELSGVIDDYFIRNRFKLYFYSRDLFAFNSPLKKDIYFFGRNGLVHEIANRHLSAENSGLFGLRKTGKTSVIFGIERTLSRMNANCVLIDCQNPAFHRRRWNKALFYIIDELNRQRQLNLKLEMEDKYTEENAAIVFEKEILRMYQKLGSKSVLLIFDEIENITFDISPSEHWAKEMDFVFFWQSLRSLFQKMPSVFTYLIVGTNSMCVEVPAIKGKDNPIFNQVPFQYIEGFDVPQTRDMVRTLGRIMGLKFVETIYGKLTEDFGGHPFLIRQVCSLINKISSSQRPVIVDRAIYDKAKDLFNREHAGYVEMILNVLRDFYNDEYEMLAYLAQGDLATFDELCPFGRAS